MRLYQLVESDITDPPWSTSAPALTYEYLKTNIFPHCTQYLKLRNITDFNSFKNAEHLYRGIAQPNNGVRLLTTHVERRPSGTSIELHTLIGKVLTSIVGYNPRSANSLFCTSDLHAAKEYGTVQIVLPTDTFEYFFLDHISDLWILLTSQLEQKEYILPCITSGTKADIVNYINALQTGKILIPPQQQIVEQFFHCLFTKIYPVNLNKNIEFAVANGYEVIFKTPRYYVISLDAFNELSS